MTPEEYNRLVNNGHTITDMRATPLNSTTKNTVNSTSKSTKEVSDGSTADYYVLPENAKELQDLISHKNMNFAVGSIFVLCYAHSVATKEQNISAQIKIVKDIIYYAEHERKRLENMHPM